MKTTFIGCVMVCVISLLSFHATAETFQAKGTIAEKGISMDIKGTFAMWDRESREGREYLMIFLLPYKDIDKDIAKGKDPFDRFTIAKEKPSPDKSKWQWCPFAYIRYEFQTGAEKKLDNVRYLGYYFHRFSSKGSSFTITPSYFPEELLKMHEKFKITKGKKYDIFETAIKGEYLSSDGSKSYWDFSVKTRIY